MSQLKDLISVLADQASDAWCVVRNSPFSLATTSASLKKHYVADGHDLRWRLAGFSPQLHADVKQICSSIALNFQSGDVISLPQPIGPFSRVRVSSVLLSDGEKGILLFFEETPRPSQSDGIVNRILSLSRRQKEILHGLYAGETNRSMSIRMGISEKTVEKHRAKVMENMHARTSAELIRMITIAHLSGNSNLNLDTFAPKLQTEESARFPS